MLFEEDGQTKGVELTCSFTYVNNSDLFDIIKRLWPSPPLQSVWYQTFLCLATSDVFVKKKKGYIFDNITPLQNPAESETFH